MFCLKWLKSIAFLAPGKYQDIMIILMLVALLMVSIVSIALVFKWGNRQCSIWFLIAIATPPCSPCWYILKLCREHLWVNESHISQISTISMFELAVWCRTSLNLFRMLWQFQDRILKSSRKHEIIYLYTNISLIIVRICTFNLWSWTIKLSLRIGSISLTLC